MVECFLTSFLTKYLNGQSLRRKDSIKRLCALQFSIIFNIAYLYVEVRHEWFAENTVGTIKH